MNLGDTFRTVVSALEDRTTTLAAPAQWLLESMVPGGRTYSGKTVSVGSSLELIPVWSAVTFISGATAQLELEVFRTDADGFLTEARDTRQWEMLHDQPNEEMAADELWEIVQAHLLLWGNSFLYKERDGLGLVKSLWPITPSRVLVGREVVGNTSRRYFMIDGGGVADKYYEDEVLHIRGLSSDGLVGYSPIQLARQQLGNMLALDEFAGRFWAEGAHLSGILIHPNTLTDKAAARVARRFKRAYTGVRRAGRIAVLEEDLKWQATGMPLKDAQFVETAELGDRRVAQMFRIPPRFLNVKTGDSLTYSTAETEGIDVQKWTLGRWTTRIKNSLRRDPGIFPPVLGLANDFNYERLLQADMKTLYETTAIGVKAQLLTQNEGRRMLKRKPVDGGDEFVQAPAPPAPAPPPENKPTGAA